MSRRNATAPLNTIWEGYTWILLETYNLSSNQLPKNNCFLADTSVLNGQILSYQLIPQIHRELSRFYRGIVADLKRLQIC